MRIFVYPGSFDPITNGHIDIIERAAKLCDKLIVAVLKNSQKAPLFTVDERVELIKCAMKNLHNVDNVEVESFSGLLVDLMKKENATCIIKGLRAISDFEYEFQMAHLNNTQNPEIETLFMMANVRYSYLSSSAVKEFARYGGNVDEFVPDCVKDALMKKFQLKL